MAIVTAAARNQSRRDVIDVSIGTERKKREMSDIFGALLGDQAGWPKCKHEQKQRENHDVDQSRIKELGRVAFDQADNDPGNDRPLDISEPTDNDDGKSFDDNRGPRKRGQYEHRAEQRPA